MWWWELLRPGWAKLRRAKANEEHEGNEVCASILSIGLGG